MAGARVETPRDEKVCRGTLVGHGRVADRQVEAIAGGSSTNQRAIRAACCDGLSADGWPNLHICLVKSIYFAGSLTASLQPWQFRSYTVVCHGRQAVTFRLHVSFPYCRCQQQDTVRTKQQASTLRMSAVSPVRSADKLTGANYDEDDVMDSIKALQSPTRTAKHMTIGFSDVNIPSCPATRKGVDEDCERAMGGDRLSPTSKLTLARKDLEELMGLAEEGLNFANQAIDMPDIIRGYVFDEYGIPVLEQADYEEWLRQGRSAERSRYLQRE